jgi:hypothetical protein
MLERAGQSAQRWPEVASAMATYLRGVVIVFVILTHLHPPSSILHPPSSIHHTSFTMAARFAKRLQKELKDLQMSPPEGISVSNCNELDRCVHGMR